MQNSDEMRFTFIWRIENFRYCVETSREPLESPLFTICRGKKKQENYFSLVIFPKGDEDESYVACYLKREADSGPHKICVLYDLALKTSETYITLFNQKRYFLQSQKHGTTKFIKRDDIFGGNNALEYLKDDALTIRCYIEEIYNAPSPVGYCQALTRIGVSRNFFTWSIEKFSSLEIDKKHIKHVPIPSIPRDVLLLLTLFLTGESTDKGRFKIEISMNPASHPIYIFLKMYIRDVNLAPKLIVEDQHWFKDDTKVRSELWRVPFNAERKKLMEKEKEYLPNNILSLGFEFTFSFGVDVHKVEMVSDGLCEMARSIPVRLDAVGTSNIASQTGHSAIFNDDKYCDAFLCTEGVNIPVYKVALCARSPVFRKMFETDMVEKRSNRVNIEDFDKKTVKLFVDSIHNSPKLDDLDWDSVWNLYNIGYKYEDNELTKSCAVYFKHNISEDNIFSLLYLISLTSDSDLKQVAQNFLSTRDRMFFELKDWIRFQKDYIPLALEMMNFLFMKTKEEN